MKRDVSSLIKDLQDACRQSLYNGNEIGFFGNLAGEGCQTSMESSSAVPSSSDWGDSSFRGNANKRRRREQVEKSRTWEEVS